MMQLGAQPLVVRNFRNFHLENAGFSININGSTWLREEKFAEPDDLWDITIKYTVFNPAMFVIRNYVLEP